MDETVILHESAWDVIVSELKLRARDLERHADDTRSAKVSQMSARVTSRYIRRVAHEIDAQRSAAPIASRKAPA